MDDVSSVVAWTEGEAATSELTCPCPVWRSDHVEEIEQDDDGDGNADSPEENATHGRFLARWLKVARSCWAMRGVSMAAWITVRWVGCVCRVGRCVAFAAKACANRIAAEGATLRRLFAPPKAVENMYHRGTEARSRSQNVLIPIYDLLCASVPLWFIALLHAPFRGRNAVRQRRYRYTSCPPYPPGSKCDCPVPWACGPPVSGTTVAYLREYAMIAGTGPAMTDEGWACALNHI